MFDTAIFVVGVLVVLLVSGGAAFSIVEVQRIGKEAVARQARRSDH